ncbi:MAG: tyrosine-type recombinase/integrase [Methanosarcina sp.]
MQEYTNFTGMCPEELIEEAEEETDARVKPRKQKIKVHITGFREYLENKGIAPLSVENRITGVRSFYKANDIVIPELQRRESTAAVLEAHKKIPNKEDIRKVLEIADPLEKAIILVGSSSGLAINEICDLRIKDFKAGYDQETGITTLSLRREKKQVDFVTFLTPEASKAVLNYLDHRSRKPKSEKEERRLHTREKQRVTSDEGYLFINRWIRDDFLTTLDEELRKLKDFTIQEMYRVLCEDTGTCAEKGIRNTFRSHGLRKWFSNRLIAARCDPLIKEFFMGHKIPDKTKASYFVADPAELKELYKNFVPYLTIQKELDPEQHPDFIRLKKESETYARAAANAAVERNELIELRAEIEKIKSATADKSNMRDLQSRLFMSQFDNTITISPEERRIHNEKINTDPDYATNFRDYIGSKIYETLVSRNDAEAKELEEIHDRHIKREENEEKLKLEKLGKRMFEKF